MCTLFFYSLINGDDSNSYLFLRLSSSKIVPFERIETDNVLSLPCPRPPEGLPVFERFDLQFVPFDKTSDKFHIIKFFNLFTLMAYKFLGSFSKRFFARRSVTNNI